MNIEYRFKDMENEIRMLNPIIKNLFDMERFCLTLSFEKNNYKDLIRISLSNTIGNTYNHNGIVTLYHKHYSIKDIENYSENEIVMLFFELQKKLNKDMDLKYNISYNVENE